MENWGGFRPLSNPANLIFYTKFEDAGTNRFSHSFTLDDSLLANASLPMGGEFVWAVWRKDTALQGQASLLGSVDVDYATYLEDPSTECYYKAKTLSREDAYYAITIGGRQPPGSNPTCPTEGDFDLNVVLYDRVLPWAIVFTPCAAVSILWCCWGWLLDNIYEDPREAAKKAKKAHQQGADELEMGGATPDYL